MGNFSNLLQILVIFLVVGSGAISWAINKMKEEAERKRLREQMRRRRDEEIRTGRPQPAPQSKAQAQDARLKELAERRQAQLRELKKQQAQGGAQGGGGVVVRPPAGRRPPAPVSTRPTTVVRPLPAGQSAARAAEAELEAERRERERRRLERKRLREERERQAAAELRQTQANLLSIGMIGAPGARRAGATAAGGAEARRAHALLHGGKTDLRALIAATEVLSKPVGLRPPGSMPWDG